MFDLNSFYDCGNDLCEYWAGVLLTNCRADCMKMTAVSVDSSISCAIRAEHTAWCWGDNFYGQHGDGTTELYSSIPVQVLLLSDVTGMVVRIRFAFASDGSMNRPGWYIDDFGVVD
jgi:hypothetical protein